MFKLSIGFLAIALTVSSASAQSAAAPDLKAIFQKHLQISEDFTLKVAEAMPAENYDFKLTKEQMSFGEQMTHIGKGLAYSAAPFTGEKPSAAKPASTSKADVIAFLKASFEAEMGQVAKLTPDDMSKSYKAGAGQTQTGYEVLMSTLNHITNHRASAEMYLRVKGITPPTYQF